MADKKATAKMATNPEMQEGQGQELMTRRDAMKTIGETGIALLGLLAGIVATDAQAKVGNIQATVAKEGEEIADRQQIVDQIKPLMKQLADPNITNEQRKALMLKINPLAKQLETACTKTVCDLGEKEILDGVNKLNRAILSENTTDGKLFASN